MGERDERHPNERTVARRAAASRGADGDGRAPRGSGEAISRVRSPIRTRAGTFALSTRNENRRITGCGSGLPARETGQPLRHGGRGGIDLAREDPERVRERVPHGDFENDLAGSLRAGGGAIVRFGAEHLD